MNISKASNVLACYMAAGIPVFAWGAPGVGKSDAVRQLAGAKVEPLIDFRAVLLDPVDLRGIPSIQDGVTRWNPPAFLPIAERDGPSGILFIDELNAAPMSVQAALFQLILDGKLGEYVLPAGWRIIAAGNRQSDRAAANRMPSALANRFAHVDMDPDVDSWCAWAMGQAQAGIRADCLAFVPAAGIAAELIAFHRWSESRGVAMLHNMETAGDLRAFPTPRSWAQVSKLLGAPADLLGDLVAGLVGEAAAAEFIGFLKVYRNLPTLAEIFASPDTTPVPYEPSAKYALAAAIGRAVTHASLQAGIRYAGRMSPEFQTMAVLDSVKRDSSLKANSAFVQWAIANQQITI